MYRKLIAVAGFAFLAGSATSAPVAPASVPNAAAIVDCGANNLTDSDLQACAVIEQMEADGVDEQVADSAPQTLDAGRRFSRGRYGHGGRHYRYYRPGGYYYTRPFARRPYYRYYLPRHHRRPR